MSKKECAVLLMTHLCNHSWHGYSQPNRNGDGEGVCVVEYGGKRYELQQGDRDCSSAVIECYTVAGISCGKATYTGNMKSEMTKAGTFRWHPMSSGYIAKAGDCYLKEGAHTAMCISDKPDLLGEFSISENGTINGKTGDQTGRESAIKPYYNYPWDGILECIVETNNNVAEKNGSTHRDYKTHVIQKGENLSIIAKKYNTTVERLVRLNDIPDKNKIYAGNTLIV